MFFKSVLNPMLCWLSFIIFFVVIACGSTHIRAFSTGTELNQTPNLTPQVATMADFWAGNAEWKFQHELDMYKPETFAVGVKNPFKVTGLSKPVDIDPVQDQIVQIESGGGSRIKVVGDTWYWFHRIIYYNEHCQKPINVSTIYPGVSEFRLGTGVKVSKDLGKTWTYTREIVPPLDNTAVGCQGIDGDFFYDNIQNRWYSLFQCLESTYTNFEVAGCLAFKDGSDPVGDWNITSLSGGSPRVIKRLTTGNKMYETSSPICANRDPNIYRCANTKYGDDGTFEIIDRDGAGGYYVGFHNYDPYTQEGTRGLVRASGDFQTYTSAGPTDAILGKKDLASWREDFHDTKGFGAMSTMKEGGYYYGFVDGFDVSLQCRANTDQNWDFGLYRTTSLTNSNWETFSQNPVFYSDDTVNNTGCDLQYIALFKDNTGQIWSNFMRRNKKEDAAFQGEIMGFYKLVKKQSVLANGDYWKCYTENWNGSGSNIYHYFGDTSIKLKDPMTETTGDASDRNCRLNLDCTVINCLNQTSFQFLDLITDKNAIYFDLKAKSNGGVGKFQVRVFLRDSNQNVIKDFTKVFDTTTEYQAFKGSVEIGAGVTKASYEIMPISGNLFFDENNLIPFNAVIAQPVVLNLDLKVILQSAYISTTGKMKTTLRNRNLIPLNSLATLPVDTVDWITVELRQNNVPIESKEFLLKETGLIDSVTFTQLAGDYQIVIKHRNHLSIKAFVTLGADINTVDLSSTPLKHGNVKYDSGINSQDRVKMKATTDTLGQYRVEDLNFDGDVTSKDRNIGKSLTDAVE
jgi:hypothetical protein